METCFNQPWANVDILPVCLEMSTAVDPNPCLLLGMFFFAFIRCFIALCYFNKIHFHSEYTFFFNLSCSVSFQSSESLFLRIFFASIVLVIQYIYFT